VNSPHISRRAVRLGLMGAVALALVSGVTSPASAQDGDSGGTGRGNKPKPTTTTSTPAPTTTVPSNPCPNGECIVTIEGESSIEESDSATREYRVHLSSALPQPISVCVKTQDVTATRTDSLAPGQTYTMWNGDESPMVRDYTVLVSGSVVPKSACANVTVPAGALQSSQTITVRAWFEETTLDAGWGAAQMAQFLQPTPEQLAIRGLLLQAEWFQGVREPDETFNFIVESTTGGPCVVAGPAKLVTITDPTVIPPPPPPPPPPPAPGGSPSGFPCAMGQNNIPDNIIGSHESWCQANVGVDPLAVDLNGDGVRTTALDRSARRYDITGSGVLGHSAWLDGSDGWIVNDADRDGLIDAHSELLGSYGVDGFGVLAGFDTDANGVVDASDAGFLRLSVWQDANGNRVTDAGELRSLAAAGISSLSLTVTNRPTTDGDSEINRHATATVNGQPRHLADVEFAFRYDLVG